MDKHLNYTIEDREGIKIINLSGTLSNLTKKEFESLINQQTLKSNIIIDMANIQVITSSGIDTLTRVCKEARSRKRRVVLMGAREDFIRTIEVLDLFELFIFVDSIEEGQTKIRYYT